MTTIDIDDLYVRAGTWTAVQMLKPLNALMMHLLKVKEGQSQTEEVGLDAQASILNSLVNDGKLTVEDLDNWRPNGINPLVIERWRQNYLPKEQSVVSETPQTVIARSMERAGKLTTELGDKGLVGMICRSGPTNKVADINALADAYPDITIGGMNGLPKTSKKKATKKPKKSKKH